VAAILRADARLIAVAAEEPGLLAFLVNDVLDGWGRVVGGSSG